MRISVLIEWPTDTGKVEEGLFEAQDLRIWGWVMEGCRVALVLSCS